MKASSLNHLINSFVLIDTLRWSPYLNFLVISSDQSKQETFILVHSAWLGAWQWESILEQLNKKGHRVITPDLPGHGSDSTLAKNITMENYVNKLIDLLDEEPEPLILVGHSFNGITISRVAELRPAKIKKLC